MLTEEENASLTLSPHPYDSWCPLRGPAIIFTKDLLRVGCGINCMIAAVRVIDTAVFAVLLFLIGERRNATHQRAQACSAQHFKECRNLSYHIDDISGETTGTQPTIAITTVASGNNGDLINFAEWLRDGTNHFRHTCEQLIQYGCLI